MDIRKYFQHYLLAIFLISIHRGFCQFEDDYEDLPAIGRCPRIRSNLKNGRVRLRYKGRVAKFLCDSGYELAGKRSSTCVRGHWSNPTPVCVARGCNRVPSIANGRVTEMYRGALLVYDCNPGYTLSGDLSIHCDGRQWNASAPTCTVNPEVRPETKCDFESATLCGWTHDPTHDFDWFRNQFATPSGHVGTGPEYDHTFGENKAGYYMYIEASSPRKTNDRARLFSPVYPSQESGGCFTFWYHMYGATTGGLRVYFKPESHVFGELSPKWEKFGDQGNQWLRGNISVPAVNENFQIIIEGIRGESYVGDSAIDDVNLSTLDCQAMENENDTTSEVTATNSCRGRCRTTSLPEDSCECKESCIAASTCCNDYTILCSNGNETIEQNSNEPETGDYYGNPLTVTVYLPTETTTEVKYSTATSNIPSQFTSQSSMSSTTSPSSTMTVPFADVSTSPSTSSTSSTSLTTDATKSSTAATVKTEPQTVADRSTSSRTSSVIPVVETFSLKPSTKVTIATARLSRTPDAVTSASSNSVKPTSSTKTTTMTSSRSRLKTPSISQTNSLATISMTAPLTTSTTTTERSTTTTTTTQRPTTTTTTTQRSTTTTPVTTTHSSTTTTPMSTTQSSTTTTPISTTQSSTTSTPSSTTTTSTSTSTMPTTTSSTTLKLIPLTLIQSMSISTPSLTSSVSQSSTVSTTTTPRYNLRPRKRTSISTSTGTTQSSSTRTSPISSSTTASTFKTDSSTVSSAMTPSRTRWRYDFKFSSTSTVSSTITSPSYRLPIYVQKTSNYPNNEPKSTTTLHPLTTPDSYQMVASKTESSKSSGSSSVITGVVTFSIICIVGIAIFYFRRRRSKRLSKLADDSELRFLPDNDYIEYSDASTLDRILSD